MRYHKREYNRLAWVLGLHPSLLFTMGRPHVICESPIHLKCYLLFFLLIWLQWCGIKNENMLNINISSRTSFREMMIVERAQCLHATLQKLCTIHGSNNLEIKLHILTRQL